jgi:serine/threonine-protein kinase
MERQVSYTSGRVSLKAGHVLGSRYEILGPLGKGGMGMVFRGRDQVTGGTVALKVLGHEWAAREDMQERFRSEMKIAQKVRHRNVCRVLDCGADGKRLYVVTELVDGIDLKRILARSGALPLPHAFEGAIQVARGLQALHDAGIVHRDVKSPNVLVDRQGGFRLLDFDLAERVEDAARGGAVSVQGTPEYMSPEQASGSAVGFASDIYSAGIVAYELFTGKVPFSGKTAQDIARRHVEDPPLPEAVVRTLPVPIVPVLRKCLDKDPARRYPRARSLVEALRLARTMTGLEEEVKDAGPAVAPPPGAVSALLGALNPLDATVRLAPRTPAATFERQSRIAMAHLVAALTAPKGQ